MAIRIIVDSSADYTPQEIEKRNMTIIPMNVTIGNEQYQDCIELSKEKFFELLTENKDFPKTSQPSPAAFLDAFEDAKEAGDEVIAIILSSALSGTYQTACMAKDMVEYDKIHVIDSQTATLCIRILADRAAKMRDQGASAEEIVAEIEELKTRIRLYAGLDTLEYLAKGGRMNKGVAALGDFAKVKPVIRITNEGGVENVSKQIGIKHCMRYISKIMLQEKLDPKAPLYFIYASDSTNCKSFVHTLEKKGFDVGEKKLRGIGSTIGSHIGPNAFGIVYVVEKETDQEE